MLENNMDETEKNPPDNKEEQGKKPEEQGQQQPAEENKVEEPKTQESTDPTSQETAETEQPSLVKTKKEEKKSIFIKYKPFIIAVIIIGVTIAAGIILALNLGKLTQRGPKTEEEVTPVATPQPTLPPVILTIQESSPSAQQATPSSKFEELLKLQEAEEATASETPTATQEAGPTQ